MEKLGWAGYILIGLPLNSKNQNKQIMWASVCLKGLLLEQEEL